MISLLLGAYCVFGFVYFVWAMAIESSNKEYWAGTLIMSLFAWPILLVLHWGQLPYHVRQFVIALVNVLLFIGLLVLLATL